MQGNGNLAPSTEALVVKDVSLQPYNSLAVPARAAYLVRCASLEQVADSLNFAKARDLNVLVLGEGSNTVFSKDFDGLLILIRLVGIELLNEDSHSVVVEVAAGENWHDFVQYSLDQAWYGLENLALIPGLVGAAPIQNIGAYGVEVKDLIETVNTLDIESQHAVALNKSECQFAYRDSIFKRALADQRVITSVVFRLSKSSAPKVSYPALAERFEHRPSPRDVFDAVCEIRASKLPMPDDIPNAGSFFKNPVVEREKYQQLKESFPSIKAFPMANGSVKLAAAWLIEQRGWKNKSVDAVYVHRDQALVIVNPNFKTGEAVLNLALAIQYDIQLSYGVSLEVEPRIY